MCVFYLYLWQTVVAFAWDTPNTNELLWKASGRIGKFSIFSTRFVFSVTIFIRLVVQCWQYFLHVTINVPVRGKNSVHENCNYCAVKIVLRPCQGRNYSTFVFRTGQLITVRYYFDFGGDEHVRSHIVCGFYFLTIDIRTHCIGQFVLQTIIPILSLKR